MTDKPFIVEEQLADGSTLSFRDLSRHYFGGYFHVILEASAEFSLDPEWFDTPELYADACDKIGNPVRFSHTMERMAVPRDEIDAARMQMLDTFRKHVVAYLSRWQFRRNYARSLYIKRQVKPRPFIPA